jgi:ABC-2 type transport system ATP-binding protein
MNALSLQHVTKTYKNGFKALKGVNLEVKHGDFFALLGANGAGKSTMIGIISSLINKTSGRVSIFGHDIDRENRQAKSAIGVVPQEINFNPFETVQNILLIYASYYGIPRKMAKIRTEHALKQMQLWDKRHTTARRLSGGMKRRVMIARALVSEPKLLLLDEPTAGVDIEIRRSMWEIMEAVNQQGTAIILTTHYLEEAENLCRNIAIIHQGMIVENSSMASLLSYININHFILDLEQPLQKVPNIPGYQFELSSEKVLNVAIPKKNTLNQLFEQLSTHNIQVKSLKNKSNRLEQLFMDIVK